MQKLLMLAFSTVVSCHAAAQTYEGKYLEANYDESKVPEYELPEVLTSFDEKK